jgi:hypothetical protein
MVKKKKFEKRFEIDQERRLAIRMLNRKYRATFLADSNIQ